MHAGRISVVLLCTAARQAVALLQDSSVSVEDEPTPSKTDENGKLVDTPPLASDAASLLRKGVQNFPFSRIVPTTKQMVLDEATKEHKPAMVLVTGTSCPTCAGLWSSMGASPTIKNLMSKFVAVSLNEHASFNWMADKGYAEQYVPRIYFVNPDGRYFDAYATRSDFPSYAYSFTDSADLEDKMSKVLDTFRILDTDKVHHDAIHVAHHGAHDAHHTAHDDPHHTAHDAHHTVHDAHHTAHDAPHQSGPMYNARSALRADAAIVKKPSWSSHGEYGNIPLSMFKKPHGK